MVKHNLDHGVVTLGWGHWLTKRDMTRLENRAELDKLLGQQLPRNNARSKGQIRGNIQRFCNEIDVGDLVVLPLKKYGSAKKWIAVGTVRGPARIDDSQQDRDARLHREIAWLAAGVPKSALQDDLRSQLTKRGPTVFELKNDSAQELWRLCSQESPALSGDEAGVLPHGVREVPEGAKTRVEVNKYERDPGGRLRWRRVLRSLPAVEVNKYERDPGGRRDCIAHHGAICKVCGLDFEGRYGEIGRGHIHVHHTTPLSQITDHANHTINPIKDLVPVCSNCHDMLHKATGQPFTVEELQRRMEQAAKRNPF